MADMPGGFSTQEEFLKVSLPQTQLNILQDSTDSLNNI
jgi:hypothetical protein